MESSPGMIWATLVPEMDVRTKGTVTPTSTPSASPYDIDSAATMRLASRFTFTWTTSSSNAGLPSVSLGFRLPGETSACVKLKSRRSSGTPRSREKFIWVSATPMNQRPRPSVWARSANTGPAEVAVRTGTPPSKWKVVPDDAEVIGVLETLMPIAEPRNDTNVPPLDSAEGMKWNPWPWPKVAVSRHTRREQDPK